MDAYRVRDVSGVGVIDGGEASRFLNAVIRHIEDPDLMLIKSLG